MLFTTNLFFVIFLNVVLQYRFREQKGRKAMLKNKINLKKIYYFLSILSFIIFYILIDIQLIDVLYLIFVLFFILKCVYFEIFR